MTRAIQGGPFAISSVPSRMMTVGVLRINAHRLSDNYVSHRCLVVGRSENMLQLVGEWCSGLDFSAMKLCMEVLHDVRNVDINDDKSCHKKLL